MLGVVFGQRGHHLNVGEAVLEIKTANQVAVGLDPVGVVDVGAAKEAQQVQFAGLDDVLQAIGRIGDVTDEFDRLDAGLAAFVTVKIRSTRLFGCSMISGVTRTS